MQNTSVKEIHRVVFGDVLLEVQIEAEEQRVHGQTLEFCRNGEVVATVTLKDEGVPVTERLKTGQRRAIQNRPL